MIEIISHPGPDRSVTLEGLRTFKVRTRRYRNRRIGDFLKELHLTEGRNTGFKKILDTLRKNGSPLPEFETDENHDYFVTRIFVREGFYDYQNDANGGRNDTKSANGTHSGTQSGDDGYVSQILSMIKSNDKITRKQIAAELSVSLRTVQRMLNSIEGLRYIGSGRGGHWEYDGDQ